MYDMKSELCQEQYNKRRSLPSQLTIIPNITPIVSNFYHIFTKRSFHSLFLIKHFKNVFPKNKYFKCIYFK